MQSGPGGSGAPHIPPMRHSGGGNPSSGNAAANAALVAAAGKLRRKPLPPSLAPLSAASITTSIALPVKTAAINPRASAPVSLNIQQHTLPPVSHSTAPASPAAAAVSQHKRVDGLIGVVGAPAAPAKGLLHTSGGSVNATSLAREVADCEAWGGPADLCISKSSSSAGSSSLHDLLAKPRATGKAASVKRQGLASVCVLPKDGEGAGTGEAPC